MPFRYQGSCEKTFFAKIKKSRVLESYRFPIEFSIDPGYIFGDLSCFFCLLFRHRFSHRFFFDFGWIWGFPGRLVRPRCRPGSATSDPGGHPDGRDRGSQGRSGWPRVTPGVAFGRPVDRPELPARISLIFHGFRGSIFHVFSLFLYKFSHIELVSPPFACAEPRPWPRSVTPPQVTPGVASRRESRPHEWIFRWSLDPDLGWARKCS